MWNPISISDIQSRFPTAFSLLGLTAEEVSKTDLCFFEILDPEMFGGAQLWSQSHDEQTCHSFVNGEWIEVLFPLTLR